MQCRELSIDDIPLHSPIFLLIGGLNIGKLIKKVLITLYCSVGDLSIQLKSLDKNTSYLAKVDYAIK